MLCVDLGLCFCCAVRVAFRLLFCGDGCWLLAVRCHICVLTFEV